ncbi:MAG: hypothetical protein ABGY75_11655 [Gemmataceae bacterium]
MSTTRHLTMVALLYALPLVGAAPVPKPADPPAFEIKSIVYVDGDGKNQTLDFNQNGIVQPRAVADQSDILIRGTVKPANAKVSGKLLVVRIADRSTTVEYDIAVEGEQWEVRIPAGDCKRSTSYKIRSADGELTVNGKALPVTEKQLSISNN